MTRLQSMIMSSTPLQLGYTQPHCPSQVKDGKPPRIYKLRARDYACRCVHRCAIVIYVNGSITYKLFHQGNVQETPSNDRVSTWVHLTFGSCWSRSQRSWS